jgi:CDP-4-dehydro-6-deoxyglucose reductase, E3
MIKTTFILTHKLQLTHDVFELTYTYGTETGVLPPEKQIQPGQYVLFQLLPGVNRAYSIASFTDTSFTLVIKRVAEGKGSPILCDAEVGTVFSGMIPLGHFTLRDTPVSKCFIGTGTGFAPLYCQMLASLVSENTSSLNFLFGVREERDLFYQDILTDLEKQHDNLRISLYLSREDLIGTTRWYVTDSISPDLISEYSEFYICGSPAMVKDARERLEFLGVSKEMIFWEQF